MNPIPLPRAISAGILTIAAAAGLASCSGSMLGQLGSDLATVETCPGEQFASFVLVDGTGVAGSEIVTEINLETLESIARRTAICGGRLTVGAFSAGSASTAPVYDGELELHGATDIARLKKVDELLAEVMTEVRENYGPAIASLPQTGTDVVGLYRLAAEHAAQLEGYAVEFTILTDGVNNLGINAGVVLTGEEAVALADTVEVPDLTGVTVTVAGLGRVAGDPLPSEMVEGLVAFYDRLCENTGASSCLSVTDWRGQ